MKNMTGCSVSHELTFSDVTQSNGALKPALVHMKLRMQADVILLLLSHSTLLPPTGMELRMAVNV